jgi:hypothetical protein
MAKAGAGLHAADENTRTGANFKGRSCRGYSVDIGAAAVARIHERPFGRAQSD